MHDEPKERLQRRLIIFGLSEIYRTVVNQATNEAILHAKYIFQTNQYLACQIYRRLNLPPFAYLSTAAFLYARRCESQTNFTNHFSPLRQSHCLSKLRTAMKWSENFQASYAQVNRTQTSLLIAASNKSRNRGIRWFRQEYPTTLLEKNNRMVH